MSKIETQTNPNFLRKHARTALAVVALTGAGAVAYELSDNSGTVPSKSGNVASQISANTNAPAIELGESLKSVSPNPEIHIGTAVQYTAEPGKK